MIVRRRTTAQASAAREGDAEMRVCAVVIAHSACMQVLYLSSGGADWPKNGEAACSGPESRSRPLSRVRMLAQARVPLLSQALPDTMSGKT